MLGCCCLSESHWWSGCCWPEYSLVPPEPAEARLADLDVHIHGDSAPPGQRWEPIGCWLWQQGLRNAAPTLCNGRPVGASLWWRSICGSPAAPVLGSCPSCGWFHEAAACRAVSLWNSCYETLCVEASSRLPSSRPRLPLVAAFQSPVAAWKGPPAHQQCPYVSLGLCLVQVQ